MRRPVLLLISAACAAAALWAYARQPRRMPFVPIEDGTTIDFSGGTPVVRQTAADKADMDRAVKAMDAAARGVTFPPDQPRK